MCDAVVESVAVGFFDGVHLGHQAILRGATSAITFSNHPLTVLAPERAPRLIMPLERRLAAMRDCGVRTITVLDFTSRLAMEDPAEFAGRLGTRVRCGEDWHFGAGGAGDAAFLRARGIQVTVVPAASYGGERISSTRIRAAIEAARMDEAREMLGRFFVASGAVFQGKGTGTALGFPTINLKLDMALHLPCGVYAVEVGGVRAIANYGVAPTMGARAWHEPVLEVHFVGEIPPYDASRVDVAFMRFLRAERTFASETELVRQIAEDIRQFGGGK